jgi:hypothetical protein
MKSLMAELEKSTTRTLTSQGCKLIQEFSARDVDGQRSLIRGVFQAATGETIVQYYVKGPTYVCRCWSSALATVQQQWLRWTRFFHL